MAEPRDPREPRIPKETAPFDADNKWTRTWIMYFESLFSLSVKEAVRQTLEVAVTHTDDLTKDLPVFGNDKADVKVGTKSGSTNKLVTNTGTNVTGNTVKWDANGNLIDAGVTPGGGGGGGGGSLVTPPPLVSSLTWINQSTATAIDASNGIYITQPSTATQYLACLVANTPATPWTFTAGVVSSLHYNVNFISFGIVCSDGTKIADLMEQFNSPSVQYTINNWNSATSASGNVFASPGLGSQTLAGGILWLRIADDGTNRKYSVSHDGVNFIQLASVGRTTFLTASKVGIAVKAQNASGWPAIMTCVSWKIS